MFVRRVDLAEVRKGRVRVGIPWGGILRDGIPRGNPGVLSICSIGLSDRHPTVTAVWGGGWRQQPIGMATPRTLTAMGEEHMSAR